MTKKERESQRERERVKRERVRRERMIFSEASKKSKYYRRNVKFLKGITVIKF